MEANEIVFLYVLMAVFVWVSAWCLVKLGKHQEFYDPEVFFIFLIAGFMWPVFAILFLCWFFHAAFKGELNASE